MSVLSDRARSSCDSSSSSQRKAFEPVTGWDSDEELQINESNQQQKVIQLANSKLSLKNILDHYNVVLENTYSSSNWSYRTSCPFDDHNDRTPSFGYNPNIDVFNCLGCHRSGRAVEFIAYKEFQDKYQVAKNILSKYGSLDLSLEIDPVFDINKIKRLLFNHASNILEFKKKNNFSSNALNYAKSLSWSVDVFLRKNTEFNEKNFNNLKIIIEQIENQLDYFEEK